MATLTESAIEKLRNQSITFGCHWHGVINANANIRGYDRCRLGSFTVTENIILLSEKFTSFAECCTMPIAKTAISKSNNEDNNDG